ncbi:MAG: hypothetical protein V3U60_11020 [Gammaproteobacteria bacterium]
MSGVKSLFRGKSGADKKLKRVQPAGFSGGGLTGEFNRETNTFDITRTSALTQGLQDLQTRLGERASAFRGLRGSSAFDDLIGGRVRAIRDAGARTVGNLREELGRRRVAGSSFASREIASTEALFGREEERARAEGRLQQLGVEASLIDQEFQASVAAANVVVRQLNLEAGLAAQLSQSASQQRLIRATLRAELQASAEAGQLEFIATQMAQAHEVGMSFIGGGGGGAAAGMMGGGAGGAGGAGAGAGAAAAASDRRLKTNIVRIGTRNGYPWYSFDYVWGVSSEGVMSDEVPQEFVFKVMGFDVVDYAGLFGEQYAPI